MTFGVGAWPGKMRGEWVKRKGWEGCGKGGKHLLMSW